MNNIRVFHSITVGESHIKKNIPCQDATISIAEHDNQIYIGVVSDGHGGSDYIKSNIGSKLLVEVTSNCIKEFMSHHQAESLFKSRFTSRNTITSGENPKFSSDQDIQNVKLCDERLNQLFKSIISAWQMAIRKDWEENCPSKEEMLAYGVNERMIEQFQAGENIPVAYGCTLLAFARTKDYWFAFQLGDGKSIAFDSDMIAIEPIPTDELCMGSVTTSMCEDNAFDNFRYAYGTDTPPVFFLGSDGMDGYFSKIEEYAIEPLKNLYTSILEMFLEKGYDEGLNELNKSLPVLSKRGVTQDDMSIAGWIDFGQKEILLKCILNKRKIALEHKIIENEKNLETEKKELHVYDSQISDKLKQLSDLGEKLNLLSDKIESSKEEIKLIGQKIQEEQDLLGKLKKENEEILSQKGKVQLELDNLNILKENKIKNIQNIENETEKSKSFISDLLGKIANFFKGK
jgi:hypothetical protein